MRTRDIAGGRPAVKTTPTAAWVGASRHSRHRAFSLTAVATRPYEPNRIRAFAAHDKGETIMIGRAALVATVILGLTASGSIAGDKIGSSFVDNTSLSGGSNGFTNAISTNAVYSVGASKSAACKLKVQFKGLTGLSDGDLLICLPGADVKATGLPAGGAGNSVAMTVKWTALTGKALGKADLRNIAGGLGCGSVDSISWNGELDCYLPDGGYNAATQCASDGGLWLAPADPTKDNLLGICQGVVLGFRLTPPGSGLLAVQGSTNPLK
jgi:hypothetical protein